MNIIILLLISLYGGIENISFKKLSEKHNFTDETSLFGMLLYALIFLIPVIIFFIIDGVSLIDGVNAISMLKMLLVSLIGTACIYFWIKASKYLKLTILDPLRNLLVVALGILSWIFFGDAIGISSIISMVLIIIFSTMITIEENKNVTKQKQDKKDLWKGLLFLFFWIAANCVLGLLQKHILLNDLNSVTYSFLENFLSAILILVFLLVRSRKNLKTEFKHVMKNKFVIIIGSSLSVGALAKMFLIKQFNIGLIGAIGGGLTSIFVILYAKFVLKEKVSLLTWISVVALLISGVIIGIDMF